MQPNRLEVLSLPFTVKKKIRGFQLRRESGYIDTIVPGWQLMLSGMKSLKVN